MKTARNQAGFTHLVLLIAMVALIGGLGYLAYQNYQNSKQPDFAVANVPLAAKVSAVAFSTALTAQGAAAAPVATFAPTTPAIYVVANISKAAKNSRLEYVRYRDGKFVDNGSLAVSKDNAQNASFSWKLKPSATHPVGKYKVNIYANGKFIRSATYEIK